jgi:chaperone BCS1
MQALLDQLWLMLTQQLESNQFLSGGFVLMVVGAAAALCRKVPGRIWSWITHRVFIEFEIPMKDNAFYWFNDWLAEQPYSKNWARWLTVRTKKKKKGLEVHDDDDTDVNIILSPAPGNHWLFWRGYFIIVNRERQDNENGGSGNGGSTNAFSIPRETFNVSILTWRRSAISELLLAAFAFANPPEDESISIYIPRYGDWDDDCKRRPRPLDSVILRAGLLEALVEDARHFLSREDWYVERGIPYRRGYMLYGPPGNGKSSTVAAIASALKLDICVLNLGTSTIGDDDLRKLFAEVPANAVVLIEDIDCVFTQREQTKDNESKVTFSGLLNAIDGVAASEGRLLFMTTNKLHDLDPALTRPGRCDVRLMIENADADQGRRLFLRFFAGEENLAATFGELVGQNDLCMAALQGHLLKHSADPVSAVSNFLELLNESQAADKESQRTQGDLGVQAEVCVGSDAESDGLHSDDSR